MSKNIKQKILRQSIILVILVIGINYIASDWFFRIDLTSEKRYSLSENTKDLFEDLDEDIKIDVFLEGDLNVGFKKLSQATYELLNELNVYAGNNLSYSFTDPSSGSVKEKKQIQEEFKKLGLSPQSVFETQEDGRKTTSYVYPYAIVTYRDYQLPINLLDNITGFSGAENLNKSIESLEYKFTDAVKRLTINEKIKIAFLEGHGELDELDVLDITDHLSQYYQVDRGVLGTDPNILNPYKAIIIAKPQKKFSESDKFIIDQYLMNGGKVLWLVDAVNITVDSLRKTSETIGLLSDLNIDDQLFKYGVRINPVLLQDVQASMIPITVADGNKPKIVPAPWLYNPLLIPQPQHSISKNLNVVKGEFVSSIDTVNPQLPLKRDFLLRTSKYTKSDQVPVFVSLNFVNEKPKQQDFNQSYLPVAVVEEGVFPSVFQNRMIPKEINIKPQDVKSESTPTKIIVVADGDIIKNKVRFKSTNPQVLPLGYDELTKENFGNKDFILNAVNYLCDDEGWMNLRARSYTLRLLDKNKVSNESFKWKLINMLLPLAFIFILALIVFMYRKITYTK
ncbi:gliding motility-associated ABC transporter substrate-binding protein GldG [Plebeiibacterium sediminum]|uniref:Gliding motility-associated ABC transporter substrate-binding protein GldG n=1 Tax=Plebeiibacterium sediminum TaxID=2992112 RepID=A0AAE3SFT2_9BACT|nr:gliding motility-associated ABC transporter substrate-binding protein GldG [Plebeiobacterium sediminum]MCW3787785.1 gliding motility-associated ABC transporter substrate-binding protein GldG [Plebeiobacterium sediminum]